MKTFLRVSFMVALATLLLLLPNRKALACTCAPEDPNTLAYVNSSFDNATAVFSGRVLKVEKVTYSPNTENWIVRATFNVYKVWKGPLYKTYVVQTSVCDYPFQLHTEYLVFAYGDEPNLIAGTSCGPTVELSQGDKYLQVLGNGLSPQLDNPYSYPPVASNCDLMKVIDQPILVLGAFAVVILTTGITLYISRIKRRSRPGGGRCD